MSRSRILFYNSESGEGSIASFNVPGLVINVSPLKARFATNWSHVLTTGSSLMFYNAESGAVGLGTMTDIAFTTTRSGSFTPGWTHVVNGPGATFLFYNSNNGAGALGQWNAPGASPSFSALLSFEPGAFSTGWTNVTSTAPEQPFSQPDPFFYNSNDGSAAIAQWIAPERLVTVKSYGHGEFSTGWSQVVAGAGYGVLFYNPQNGAAAFGTAKSSPPAAFTTTQQFQLGLGWSNAILINGTSAQENLFFVYDSAKGSGGFVGTFAVSGYTLEAAPNSFPRDRPFPLPNRWVIAETFEAA